MLPSSPNFLIHKEKVADSKMSGYVRAGVRVFD